MVPLKRSAPGEDAAKGNPIKTCPSKTPPTPPPTPDRLSRDSPCPKRPPVAPCVSPLHAVIHTAAPASPAHTSSMDSQREPDMSNVPIDTLVANWPGPTGAASIGPGCSRENGQTKSYSILESNSSTSSASNFLGLPKSNLVPSKNSSGAIHDGKNDDYDLCDPDEDHQKAEFLEEPLIFRKYRSNNPASEQPLREGSMQYVHEKFLNDFGADIFDEDDME